MASSRQDSPRLPCAAAIVLGVGGSTPYSATAIFFLTFLIEALALSDGLNVYCTII